MIKPLVWLFADEVASLCTSGRRSEPEHLRQDAAQTEGDLSDWSKVKAVVVVET